MAELGQRTTLRIMVDADEGPKKELFGFMARSGHLAKGRGRPPKWPLRPIPSAELLIAIRCTQPYQTRPPLSRARIQGMDPGVLLSTIASFPRYSRMDLSRCEDRFQSTFASRVGPVARSPWKWICAGRIRLGPAGSCVFGSGFATSPALPMKGWATGLPIIEVAGGRAQ
jgi:hypothetical protein